MADEELNLEEEAEEETEDETEEEEEETVPTPVMDFWVTQNRDKRYTFGMHDAKVGDHIVQDIPTRLVFVSSQAELDDFTAIEPVGTFAATYGLGTMWHLNASREWVEV